MGNEIGAPDLEALANKIIERSRALSERHSALSGDFALLVGQVCAAIGADDLWAQRKLLGDIDSYLKREDELCDAMRRVFQMYYFYVSFGERDR